MRKDAEWLANKLGDMAKIVRRVPLQRAREAALLMSGAAENIMLTQGLLERLERDNDLQEMIIKNGELMIASKDAWIKMLEAHLKAQAQEDQ